MFGYSPSKIEICVVFDGASILLQPWKGLDA